MNDMMRSTSSAENASQNEVTSFMLARSAGVGSAAAATDADSTIPARPAPAIVRKLRRVVAPLCSNTMTSLAIPEVLGGIVPCNNYESVRRASPRVEFRRRSFDEQPQIESVDQLRRASTDSADTSPHTRTHTGYEFTSTSAVATHQQRNCRSSGKVLNLKIVLDWLSGAISPMAKCWTTTAGHARCGRTARHCLRFQ